MAKAIMIQGTMSNAGKSLLVAALCRIFAQDGYRVAPFKSQNMALNSFITKEGLEIGRAQAVQAEAAGIAPSADMNPVLLKPTTDTGSQVIVNGIVRANMSAKDYFAYKQELIPEILASYRRLEASVDIIVIEGAGSPVEINLNKDDIVNMGLARLVDAPVLLVGDIDRGGVFAQLYGTVSLLKADERARLKGLIINKFRGDTSILAPGVKQLETLCACPVFGVVPYMEVDIEDEDSLSGKLDKRERCAVIDIAAVRFPRLSNFTDLDVFRTLPGVGVRFVDRPEALGSPDLIILPGTKNTIDDMAWLKSSGLEAVILKAVHRDTPVWGICGGYQMLGEYIRDPEGAETDGCREIAGLGLLPTVTEFFPEKVRVQVEGAFAQVDGCFSCLSGRKMQGYEIHMGRTWVNRENGLMDTAVRAKDRAEPYICRPLAYLLKAGEKKACTDGLGRGNIYGTYVHGVFDAPGIAGAIVDALAHKKGICLESQEAMDYASYKEAQYDRLAECVRSSLDMDAVYALLFASEDATQEHTVQSLRPGEIEKRSFEIIAGELAARGKELPAKLAPVIMRTIHTTADFDYAENLIFTNGAMEHALAALKAGAVIITDTQMARSGINKTKLKALGGQVLCFMSDEDVASEAKVRGTTRAVISMEKAAKLDFGGKPLIFAVGNAPTALLCLCGLIGEGKLTVSLLVGVPVGFVNVEASKERALSLKKTPCIVARGRKGGSNVAAAIINALLYQL